MSDGSFPVDGKAAERRERFLASLLQTEWLAPSDLELYQRRLLERVVRHAHAETVYYSTALAPLFGRDGTIDWDRWHEVPILDREAVQNDPETLFARSVPEQAGGHSEIRTSGSTGRPIRILYDQLAGFASHMLDARFYRWHGIDPGLGQAIIKSYPGGDNAYPEGTTGKMWHVFGPDADLFTLNTTASVEQQIEWLERRRPAYLCSYPSNILEMARTIGTGRGRRLGLKGCLSFAETVNEDAHAIVHEAFGAPLLDRYGCTEVGQISAQCPTSTAQHVAMENVFLEILDDGGQPVGPGGTGRVVVSGLYSYSMPFIRYDVGDYAVAGLGSCPCGRSLKTIERVLGRERSMFRFADGSVRIPYVKLGDIEPLLPCRQFQVAQTHLDQVELRYVPLDGEAEIDKDGLTGLFRRRMHPSLTVRLRPMAGIPRAPGGKFFEYVSELDSQD